MAHAVDQNACSGRETDAICPVEKGNPNLIVRHGFEAGSLYDRVERFSYQSFDGHLSGGFIIIDAGYSDALGSTVRLFLQAAA
jgi:hypothetical protein